MKTSAFLASICLILISATSYAAKPNPYVKPAHELAADFFKNYSCDSTTTFGFTGGGCAKPISVQSAVCHPKPGSHIPSETEVHVQVACPTSAKNDKFEACFADDTLKSPFFGGANAEISSSKSVQ